MTNGFGDKAVISGHFSQREGDDFYTFTASGKFVFSLTFPTLINDHQVAYF